MQHIYSNSNRTLARLVILAVIVTSASVMAQNLPQPGAYQPIPNFTGVGAGVQFRKSINDRFSGAQRVVPAIATVTFANFPPEQDVTLIDCQDCKLTSPCAATGAGAWALGGRGQWSCSNGPLEANLNANGIKLTNLASGTIGGDAPAFGQSARSNLIGTLPNPIVQTVLGGKTPIYSNQANAALEDSALPALGTATVVQGQPTINITLNKPWTVVSTR